MGHSEIGAQNLLPFISVARSALRTRPRLRLRPVFWPRRETGKFPRKRRRKSTTKSRQPRLFKYKRANLAAGARRKWPPAPALKPKPKPELCVIMMMILESEKNSFHPNGHYHAGPSEASAASSSGGFRGSIRAAKLQKCDCCCRRIICDGLCKSSTGAACESCIIFPSEKSHAASPVRRRAEAGRQSRAFWPAPSASGRVCSASLLVRFVCCLDRSIIAGQQTTPSGAIVVGGCLRQSASANINISSPQDSPTNDDGDELREPVVVVDSPRPALRNQLGGGGARGSFASPDCARAAARSARKSLIGQRARAGLAGELRRPKFTQFARPESSRVGRILGRRPKFAKIAAGRLVGLRGALNSGQSIVNLI